MIPKRKESGLRMPTSICFFEDQKFDQFYPLTLARPVYVLRAGIVELYQRVERHFPEADLAFACRSGVAAVLAESHRDVPVNIIKRSDGRLLLVNGRIRDWGDLPGKSKFPKESARFVNGDDTVAVLMTGASAEKIPAIATQQEYADFLAAEGGAIPRHDTTATLYNYLWELVEDIEAEVTADFEHLRPGFDRSGQVAVHPAAAIVNEEDVYLGDSVSVAAGAVIDASHGPVYIGANTRIESHAAIFGPCFIGANSVVLAGKVVGSSIGHTCRVGGEVEESIFHAYVNKYHAGFIGHSYVAPWVNFGAMTTNSDLKNNYSEIRVTLNGETVDTGSIKVGSFIGDHTKFGIGTLLNTGIIIGACCNIFGGTLVTDKEIPSFRWGGTGNWSEYRFDKALETARRTAERRNCELSKQEADLLEAIRNDNRDDGGVLEL